jgi:hypothetical protein
MFQMLASALTQLRRSGSLPATVKLSNVFGPADMTANPGPAAGEFTVESVVRAAAAISDRLNDDSWKPIPANTIPSRVDVAGTVLSPGQFLELMADAYTDPTPARKMKINIHMLMNSNVGGAFPHHAPTQDMGSTWTLKPAFIPQRFLGAMPPLRPPTALSKPTAR